MFPSLIGILNCWIEVELNKHELDTGHLKLAGHWMVTGNYGNFFGFICVFVPEALLVAQIQILNLDNVR